MIGSQGLKSADAERNTTPPQHSALAGWRGTSDNNPGEAQRVSFPRRDVFHPAPQPAVGAAQTGPQRYSTLAANDAAAPKRRGRYNWDGRSASQPAPDNSRPSVARRILLPAGGLVLLAGVALGAFYLMHTFAAGPQAATADAAPAKTQAIAAAAVKPPAAATETRTSKTDSAVKPQQKAAAGEDTADRVAVPAAPAKAAALSPKGVAVASVKVPAPDNARWGEARDPDPEAAPPAQAGDAETAPTVNNSQAQAGGADAATPKVNDPQTAPVPTETPKAEAPKKLAYAAPAKAPAHPVDKAVTAALPPASPEKGTTPPGVNPDLLSSSAKTSADETDAAGGGYASTVRTDVKLHAAPSNGSRSIGIVPKKATVQVLNCSGWCKVSYGGKQGYVFKSFLGHASAPAPAASEKTAKTEAPAAAQPAQAQPAKAAAAAPADPAALKAAAQQTMMRR